MKSAILATAAAAAITFASAQSLANLPDCAVSLLFLFSTIYHFPIHRF